MFLRGIVVVCLLTGLALVSRALSQWLTGLYWILVGIVLTDISYIVIISSYATRHSRLWVMFYSFGCVILTIDAIRKYNKLRQAAA